MSLPSFGPVARHYDELMSGVPYEMWANYARLLFACAEVSPETILDVCCGTGSICEIMSVNGYRMSGFDLSPEMIAEARTKARNKALDIDYHVADAAELNLGRRWDAAISFFDSLNYIVDPERARMAIERVAAHLEPGGAFVFDVNTAYAFEESMFDQSSDRGRDKLRYDWKGSYDPDSRVIRVKMNFWTASEHFVEEHVQRAHTHEELMSWMQGAGFERIRCYDSYTTDPPRERSDRLHYVGTLPS